MVITFRSLKSYVSQFYDADGPNIPGVDVFLKTALEAVDDVLWCGKLQTKHQTAPDIWRSACGTNDETWANARILGQPCWNIIEIH